jgi:hypothetical protein
LIFELARGWRPSGLSPVLGFRRGRGGGLRYRESGVGEQVPGTSEQFAGDRGGGDLLAPPPGDGQRLRHQLLGYFPAALEAFEDLDAPDALELLGKAPDRRGLRG